MAMITFTPRWYPLRAAVPSIAALFAALFLIPFLPKSTKPIIIPAATKTATLSAPQKSPAPIAPVPTAIAPPVEAGPAPAGPYAIRSMLPLSQRMKHGEWVWRPETAPAPGPMLIFVDTAAQVMSVFRGGHEIGAAVILYGADHKPTPLGRFKITAMKEDHWSSIYEDAPMPYMMRLTNDGIALHGTEKLAPNLASNGCVGMPIAFAKLVFGEMQIGDKVVIVHNRNLRTGETVTVS